MLILALVVMTSGVAGILAVRRGAAPHALPAALSRLAEGVGLGVVFLAANVGLGVLVIRILGRALGPGVSVYTLDDAVLVALSALQGLALRWWLDRT